MKVVEKQLAEFMIIRGTAKILGFLARVIGLGLAVCCGVLLAAYIIAGVAFRGDWGRVDKSIEKAYDEFFDN
jgi:hypothetical protein